MLHRIKLVAALLGAVLSVQPVLGLELGSNLAGIGSGSYWAFNDIFRQVKPWLTKYETGSSPWDTEQSGALTLDSNGYPKRVPFTGTDGKSHIVHSIWENNLFPTGTYTLTFAGEGTIRILEEGQTHTFSSADGHVFTFSRDTATQGIRIEIPSSDPKNTGNYIRDVHLVVPGQYDSTKTSKVKQTFNQAYLNTLAIYDGPLRFMDWQRTNNSSVTNTRTLATNYTQSVGSGVAVELMVELANAANRDLWITIPHQATAPYITAVANVIQNNLNPGLKVWVEYSNEVWNGQFQQNKYVVELAKTDSRYLNESKWPAIYAEKAALAWKLFRDAFTDDSRVVRVLAGQGPNDWTVTTAYNALADSSVNPTGQYPEVLAPATYFDGNISPTEDSFDAADWSGGTNRDGATWSGNWTTSGSVAKRIANPSETDPAKYNRVVDITNSGSITRTVDTTTASNGTLGLGVSWSATGFESGDAAYLEVYIPATGTWVQAAKLEDGDDDGSGKSAHFSPVPGFTPSTSTKVRIRLAGNDSNDKLTVTGVRVIGHPSIDALSASIPGRIDKIAQQVEKWTKFAAGKGVVVYAYEGGQHFVAATSIQNDDVLTGVLTGLNRDARMYGHYVDWLDSMQAIGVQGIAHYSDIGEYSKYGSWGAREFLDQTLASAHKYRALKEWTPDKVVFDADTIGSYNGTQDVTPAGFAVQDSGATLALTGNTWKRVPYGYRVTSKTRLAFDFKSTVKGDVHGIGLDTDVAESSTQIYKLYGTQSYGRSGAPAYTGNGAWQSYDFSVADLAGPVYYLVFENDHDVTSPTATSWFRNVILYEAP